MILSVMKRSLRSTQNGKRKTQSSWPHRRAHFTALSQPRIRALRLCYSMVGVKVRLMAQLERMSSRLAQ